MPSLSRTILGRPARRRKAAPPPVSARRAPPAPAPAAPAAPPQRRPVTEAPAKPDTVRAIVVDPAERSVNEVTLATEPGDASRGYGVQIAKGEIEDVIGSEEVEFLDLGDGNSVAVDALRQSETVETWTLEDDEPIAGPGVIIHYDAESDTYASTEMPLAEARAVITFGDDGAEDAEGDDVRKKIDELLGGLDDKQRDVALHRALSRPEVLDAIDEEAFALKAGARK